MTEEEAREHPVLYDIVRDRVRPARAANKRASYARYWWRFGETRTGIREALRGLDRYIVTPETAKHRVFQFLPHTMAAEHSVICIALEDDYSLGVLSSLIHVTWALAAGGRLGVGNDARYQKALCFDPFPCPQPSPEQRIAIAAVAGRIDTHRGGALDRDERTTITGMYNVVEKLRSGDMLTDAEQVIRRLAACGVLRDLHDELDVLVADAYGWTWPLAHDEILAKLLELHDQRRIEEAGGRVRWLRPDYQAARSGGAIEPGALQLLPNQEPVRTQDPTPWPTATVEQISALQSMLTGGTVTVESAVSRFAGARRDIVLRHLETLALMGEARVGNDGAYEAVVSSV